MNKRPPDRIGPALLPFVGFDLGELLRSVRATRITAATLNATVSFHRMRTLACVEIGPSMARIRIHEALNREDTPRQVLEYIIGHELLHTVVRPHVERDGKVLHHPPEFREMERRLLPEGNSVWRWLNEALFGCIHRDTANESTRVKSHWPKILIGPFPAFRAS